MQVRLVSKMPMKTKNNKKPAKGCLRMTMEDAVGVISVTNEIGRGGCTPESFEEMLNQALEAGAKSLRLRINSVGGEVIAAMAIHDMVKNTGLPVVAEVYGMAASAATLVALSAEKVRMAPNATWMMHEPTAGFEGEFANAKSWLDFFETLRERIYDLYAARSGKGREELEALLAADVYLTTPQALEMGFATEILDDTTPAPEPVVVESEEEGDEDDAPEEVQRGGQSQAAATAAAVLSAEQEDRIVGSIAQRLVSHFSAHRDGRFAVTAKALPAPMPVKEPALDAKQVYAKGGTDALVAAAAAGQL